MLTDTLPLLPLQGPRLPWQCCCLCRRFYPPGYYEAQHPDGICPPCFTEGLDFTKLAPSIMAVAY
jgi:recombinational DNA repair protein (RecF pathway)